VWGGIIGLEGAVAWHDLTRPAFATLTPQEADDPDGATISYHRRHRSTKRTALDRYDFEFDFRRRVVDTALRRTSRDEEPMVRPVSVAECARCPWNAACHADLATVDDVSLVSPVGYAEWRVHRFMGIATVHELAALDPDEAVERYADTPLTPTALVKHIECARSADAGELIVAPGWDESEIPRGDVEIDLDLENDEYVYLWGARLSEVPAHWPERRGSYVHFSSFEPLDEQAEVRLAAELWDWLIDLRQRAVAEGLSVRIYGYNAGPVEGAALRRLVPSDELEVLLVSDEWVDLLPLMRRKYWSNWGHGLKVVAAAAGFAWRDGDPGGFASMQWYRHAIDGVDREANINRVLSYNQDDCTATAALRGG
jgi:predicted RecB family nuclease